MIIQTDPRRAFDALSGQHGLPILRFLQGREWTLASQVSDGLGIHTSTASKYLAAFHDAGILERRAHAAKRPTFAYRLPSPVIRIEFHLVDGAPASDVSEAASAFLETFSRDAEQLGGSRLTGEILATVFGSPDPRTGLAARLAEGDPRAALESIVRDVRRAARQQFGDVTADRLVRHALDAAGEGRRDVVAAIDLGERSQ